MSEPGTEMEHAGHWDATTEAATAAAAAAAATAATAAMQEGHHHHHVVNPTGTTPDPVLAAATAAAMGAQAAAVSGAVVDASATEAAVALGAAQAAAAAVGGQEHHQHLVEHHGVEHHGEGEGEAPPPPIGHGGGSVGSKQRKNFDDRLKELRKFKQKHGHCNVPHKYHYNPQLGTWVDTQRRLYRNHKRHPAKPTTLTQESIDKLIDLGFNFEPRPSREETWNTRLAELANYKAQHGHCNCREDDQSYPGLGKWISYVRRQFRLQRQGRRPRDSKRLDQTRLTQLRDVGFVFELREEMAHKRFREGIASLRRFREETGHVEVPSFYESNPTLGLVVDEMRREAGKVQNGLSSTMTDEMVGDLIDLGLIGEMPGMPPQAAPQVEVEVQQHAEVGVAPEQAVAPPPQQEVAQAGAQEAAQVSV